MKNTTNLIIGTAVAIGLLGLAFFGGAKYQQSKNPASIAGQRGGFGAGNQRAGIAGNGQNRVRMNGQPNTGEIIAQDDKSITIKLSDGSTKIVLLSESTTINKSTEATKNDLKIGEKVGIFGMENTDGSITAQSIQINPIFRGSPSASPSSSPTSSK